LIKEDDHAMAGVNCAVLKNKMVIGERKKMASSPGKLSIQRQKKNISEKEKRT